MKTLRKIYFQKKKSTQVGCRDNRITSEKKIKLEPIKKESNDEIQFTFLHSCDRLKRQDNNVKRKRKR